MYKYINRTEYNESLFGHEQSVVGNADERNGGTDDRQVEHKDDIVDVSVKIDEVVNIPMSQWQSYQKCDHGYGYMDDEADVKLFINVLCISYANLYRYEAIGCGNHDLVENGYESDNASNQRKYTKVGDTQCLQCIACRKQTTYCCDEEPDKKYPCVIYDGLVGVFFHTNSLELQTVPGLFGACRQSMGGNRLATAGEE